jgi:hypothetical protein
VIAEAIDTVLTLGWALAAWIVGLALAAALALHTVLAIAWWAGRAALRARAGLHGRLSVVETPDEGQEPQLPSSAPRSRTRRPTPSWAHTDHHRVEEAA